MGKRIGSLLLVLVMVFSMVPTAAFADADATEGSGHVCAYTDGVCECGEKDPNYVAPDQEPAPAVCEHVYENGVCSKCQAADPDYVAPTPEVTDPEENTAPSCEHTYAEGVCSLCQAAEPGYVAPCADDAHVAGDTGLCTVCGAALVNPVLEDGDGEVSYAATIGEAGYESLAAAITAANAGDTIILADGTHTMPNSVAGENITIQGGKNAVVEMLTAVGANGSTIAFEGVTAKFDNDGYEGLQHATKVTYTNCTLIGTQFLYAPEVSFTNCNFEMYNTATEYSVWTYGAKNVTFTNCVFNTNGKAILVYIEAAHTAEINVSGCTFYSNGTFTGKAAVEVGQSANGNKADYTLKIEYSTADQNFVANNSTSNLWGNKNSMGGAEGGLKVNGEEIGAPAAKVAKIGEVEYTSLADAFAAANAGDTIILLADVDLTGWTSVDVKKAITLDGKNKTITGLTAPLVKNSSADFQVKDLIISGASIDVKSASGSDNDTSAAALVQWANGGTLTLNNVSVTGSTISGDGYVAALVGFVDSTAAGVKVNGCAISGNTLTAGGIVGAVSAITYAAVTVEGVAVSGNTLTSNSDGGTRTDKVGLVVGRPVADTVSVSAIVDSTNAAKPVRDGQDYPVIGSLSGGAAVLTGGSYPSDPTVTGKKDGQAVSVKEGFEVKQNDDGTFGLAEKSDFVARIGETEFATLAAAITAVKDGETITLADGTHKWDAGWKVQNKAVTFSGSRNAIIDMQGVATGQNTSGATLTFSGVTLMFARNQYQGFQHTAKVVFNNCALSGRQTLYAPVAEFTNCELTHKSTTSVWTYGASNVTFTGCTFYTGGRAVQIYNEQSDFTADVSFTDCTFKSDGSDTNKSESLVELNRVAGSNNEYVLSFDGCKTELTNDEDRKLWGNSSGYMGIDENEKSATVTINGEQVYPLPTYVAQIDNIGYESLAAAITAAGADETITLLADVEWETSGQINGSPMADKSVTIDGQNQYTLTATGDGIGAICVTEGTLTLKNLTVADESVSYVESAWEAGYLEFAGSLAAENVTFKDPILFQGAEASFEDCTFTGKTTEMAQYGAWIHNGEASFTKCTFNGTRGLKAHSQYDNKVTAMTVTNSTFNCTDKPGIALGDVPDSTITVTNNTFNGVKPGDQKQFTFESDTGLDAFKLIRSGNIISDVSSVKDVAAGTYEYDPTNYLAEGYKAAKNEDGTWTVEQVNYVAFIGNTGYETLAEAIAAVQNGETIILADGTHKWDAGWKVQNKAVTITGTTNAVIDMTNVHTGQNTSGAELTFDGITLTFSDTANYKGFAHTEKLVYKDCVINGKQHLYAPTVVFTNCDLNNSNDYSVWTYGASDVEFTGCTFNSGGKAILVYNEDASGSFVANIDLTNCTFYDDDTLDTKKAAVELGNNPAKTSAYNVKFTGCTVNGFAVNDEGISTGSTFWGNKDSMNKESGVGGSSVIINNSENQMPAPAITGTITQGCMSTVTETRTRLTGELTVSNTGEKLVIELYSGENKIATSTLVNGTYIGKDNMTLSWNFIIKGEESSSWKTEWVEGFFSADYVPNKVVLTIDGEVVAENNVTMNANNDLAGTWYNWADFFEAELFKLAGTNMVLGSNLAMNFFVNMTDVSLEDAKADKYYAVVTRHYSDGTADDVQKIMSSKWDARTTMFAITYDKLAAKQMVDKIEVEIYTADDQVASEKWNDSIRDYAMRMVDGGSTQRQTFFVDMLNYGAAAQTYFNYAASDLANNQLTAEQQAKATASVTMTNGRVKGDNYVGTTLSLESNLFMSLVFDNIAADDLANMKAVVTFTDHYGTAQEMSINGTDFRSINTENGRYAIDVSNIAVADARQLVSCTVYNGETVYGSATDSIESYVSRMTGKNALYEPIMKFCVSAYNYIHSLG